MLAMAMLCVLTGCSSGKGDAGEGGGCVFGVEWHGVKYIDPAVDGRRAKLPEASGHFLGVGRDLCPEPGTSRTWRLYRVPGVSPEVAVTTEDARYIGVAEGKQIPEQLLATGTR
jgi:hypothetical protein